MRFRTRQSDGDGSRGAHIIAPLRFLTHFDLDKEVEDRVGQD